MERARVAWIALLAAAALLLTLPDLNKRGFWFDEAFTARTASLPFPRLLDAAQRDIHPPGWPLLCWLSSWLTGPTEVALRLPSALCLAGLVALVGRRSPLSGLGLLWYGALVDHAEQARPYAALALGLVGVHEALAARRWGVAGVIGGLTFSLHALAGPLLVLLGAPTLLFAKPRPQEVTRLVVPFLVLTAWWFPSWLPVAARYAEEPWYLPSTSADWWMAVDGGGVLVASAMVIAGCQKRDLGRLAGPLLVALALVTLHLFGAAIEIRKTGVAILPLLLVSSPSSVRATAASLVSLAALALLHAPLPARPDLRQAAAAVSELPPTIPVVSVFASETAWYLRTPAPLPASRFPEDVATRVRRAAEHTGSPCVVTISLPGEGPAVTHLSPDFIRLRRLEADGLDVWLVGTGDCTSRLGSEAGPQPVP